MKLEVCKDTDLLIQPTQKWDFTNPPFDLVDFSEALINLIVEKKGLGVAANQTGHPYSVFAIVGSPQSFVFVNPKIVNLEFPLETALEGCLSFPGLGFKRERYKEVRLRFSAPDGQTYTKTFKGLAARVIQHEMDHIEGVPFWSGVSKLKFDLAIKKAQGRGWKDYKRLTYSGRIGI